MSNFSKSPNELYGWDINKQLSQAKKINADREQGLIKYKKKTQAYNDLNSELDKYEAEGTDVSSLRKKLDSKMELGLKDSLGVVGRNIGREYAKTAYKILGVDNPEVLNTYRDRVDNAKFERESSVNPYSTLAKDIALDPANLVPINFASKGTKAIRMAKDFGKGAGIVGGLSFARDYGKDEYDPITTGVSAITGGIINSLLGRVINRKVSGNLLNADVTSAENIKAKAKEKGITLIDNGKSTLKDGKYENPKIDAEDIFFKINNEDGTPAPLQKRRVEPEFRKEKINPDKPKEPNFTFTTKDDVNPANLPSTIESNNINNLIKRALQKRLDSASKHQNYEELLNNRKDVLAKEIRYKKNLENPRLIFHDNKGDGYETDVIPASYSKNYNSDFRLTKKDVRDIKNKKLTPKLLNKLEDDLGAYDEPSSPYYKGFDTNNNGEVIGSDGKPLFANGQTTLAGGFAGGTDSSINERDYDGNGVHNERDVLIGSLIGAIGLKASQKLFPKMFKAEDGDVSRVIVPSEDFEKVKDMFKEKGIEVPIIRQRKGETSNSAIKRSSDGKSDYIYSSPTVSGAIAGGFSGTQIDYNNDGVTDEKDILIGALGGVAGAKVIKHTDYLKRKAKTIKDFTNEKILDTKMADFIFGHKIYNKHHYMAFREKMISNKNHLNTDYELLHNKLLLVDEQTRKDMYRYMSGENVALTPNVKQFADKYIKTINETTQDLVDLGVLEQAQADKFKGKYLKRVYTSKLGDSGLGSKGKKIESVHGRGRQWVGTEKEFKEYEKQGLLGDFFDGKIEAYKQPNGKYKFTQDWSQEQRERWGEVEDIAYSLPETLRRINEMKQHSLFLKDVSKRSEYALDSEADGYVRVDGKKYGLLKGKYIPTDIKRDIDEFNNALFGMDEKSKEMWRTFSTYWKKSKTVYNPTAHVNNVMSNVVMQIMEGINPAKAFKNAKAGMEASQKVAQLNELMSKQLIGLLPEEENSMNALLKDSDVLLYMEAEKLGLFGRSRLNDVLGNYVKGTDKSQTLLGSKTLNKMDETSSKWYQAEDDIMRFSVLKAFVENGYSIKKAVKKTNTIIPDYTKPMSGLANIGRNTLLTPFISWTYYATPILYRQAKEHPERLALIAGAMYGINRLAGVDPLSEEDIPQQNFSMKRIPIYVNGNEVTTIKVDRWIPHLDLLSPHDFAKNLTNLGFWGNVTGSIRNVHPYFGGKITYRDGIKGASDIAKYNIQNTLPTPMLFNQAYNLVESQILSKKSRKKHPVIQPRSGVEEALKLLGVNIMTYDKEQQRKKAYRDRLK